MALPGYDPEDIDNALVARLSEREIAQFLSEEERRRWESGEYLIDLLDEEDIHRLFEKTDEGVPP